MQHTFVSDFSSSSFLKGVLGTSPVWISVLCMFKGRQNWFHFCTRWAFCWLPAGGWESSSLAVHKLFAPGNSSIVIDTGYWFLLHCSMINAHLQQIWGLIKQNYVILQRKEDLIIYMSECQHTAGLKNFKLAFFSPLFLPFITLWNFMHLVTDQF